MIRLRYFSQRLNLVKYVQSYQAYYSEPLLTDQQWCEVVSLTSD